MRKVSMLVILVVLAAAGLVGAADFTFPTAAGPYAVTTAGVTVPFNDSGNAAGVPAAPAGEVYKSFSVTADWAAVSGNPYSNEADLTVHFGAAGSTLVDPPTSGAGANGNPTTLVFQGTLMGYDPAVDGTIEVVLHQSYTGSTASWSNLVVTLRTAIPPADYTVDDTCSTPFEDISGTGTGLALADDGEANIQMPFDFGFYGTILAAPVDIRVGNNGGLILGATTGDVAGGNSTTLPSSGMGLGIMPFWDDIDSDTGNVFWEVRGTAPNRRLIVQWYDRPHYSNVGSATFQAVLFEATSEITFVYSDLDFGNASYDNGASATVGIQSYADDVAHPYSVNTVFTATCVNFTPEFVPVELQSFGVS